MDPAKLLDWLRLTPRHLFAAAVATSLLLFLPETVVARLGLAEALGSGRPWLGVAWLASIAMLAAHAAAGVVSWGRRRLDWRLQLRRGAQRLHALTSPEKTFLAAYLSENTRTQYGRVTDGVVRELEVQGIVWRASSISSNLDLPYNIQPWAWDYLTAHPELVADQAAPGDHRRLGRG